MDIYLSINVYGKELETCCDNPETGFFRNGMCDTCKEDFGVHTVCILATEEFLVFSKVVCPAPTNWTSLRVSIVS